MSKEKQTKKDTISTEKTSKKVVKKVVKPLENVNFEMDNKVKAFLKQISDPNVSEIAINNIAEEEVKEIIKLSKFLNKPIDDISNDKTDSNTISSIILDLKNKIEIVSPTKKNVEDNAFQKILMKFGGKSSIHKYLNKFRTYSEIIESIVKDLDDKALVLKEDNILFAEDKSRLEILIDSINNKVNILNYARDKLNEKITTLTDENEIKFLKQEVLYNINLQVMDLQQTLLAATQGVLALDVLIKNNNELFRTSKRIKSVTMLTLNIGVMISVGLSNQKIVLDTSNALTEASNTIINRNSELLRTQGLEIQKQASSNLLNMEQLRASIEETLSAIEEAENYRINALPEMKATIEKTQLLMQQFDKKIELMHKQGTYLENK